MKIILRWLFRILYRFVAFNESVLDAPGPVLLLANHTSWWDWALLGVCLDDDWRFVTSSVTAEMSWVHKRIMVNHRTFPVDMNSPYAVRHMAEYLKGGGRLVLFPEGRLSQTGSLMKIFEGTGFLIHKTRPKLILAYLRGAQRLPYSPSPDRTKWFPRISVHFSRMPDPPSTEHLSGSAARTKLTEWLREQLVNQKFEVEMRFGPRTLPSAIVESARKGPGRIAVQDSTLAPLTYRRLMAGACVLKEQWQRRLLAGERRVGVLLPNVNAMPVTLLSLWVADRIPAVLNYSSGVTTLLNCSSLAGLKQIITSQTLMERLGLDAAPFKAAGIELLFLEEVRASISGLTRLRTVLRALVGGPKSTAKAKPEDTAVILFTSGSEAEPKGVELTHANLLANIRQMLSVVDLWETDRFFNALPLFHSFGLTVGLLLPLVQRVFVFLYPSPLHYRVVPSAFYNLNCTIFFGTNTFLVGYARKAHPYDFRALRYVFCGAEKLQASTAEQWMEKFGARILEGYGATECSPCISVNLPMRPRQGSVGRLLPGISYKLEPVDGVAEGGRLFVRGPNVMRGYVNSEANARFQALGGWYDTGDIMRIDSEGFLFVLGRLKRFAKVAGEMVSLSAVEDVLAQSFPQYGPRFSIAVIAGKDEAKGEKLIAVTNEPRLSLDAVRQAIRSHGLGQLTVPRELKFIRELPRLGTGKANHRELAKMFLPGGQVNGL